MVYFILSRSKIKAYACGISKRHECTKRQLPFAAIIYVHIYFSNCKLHATSSTSSEKNIFKKTPLFISVNSVRSTSIDIFFFNFQDKYS